MIIMVNQEIYLIELNDEIQLFLGGVGVSAAFSYPILENGSRDYSGVTKTSFGLGSPSIGYGSGYTKRLF